MNSLYGVGIYLLFLSTSKYASPGRMHRPLTEPAHGNSSNDEPLISTKPLNI